MYAYCNDKFDFSDIMLENFSDKESILANEKFYISLDESNKLKVMDKVSVGMLKSSRERLEYLNKRGVYGDIPKTKGNCLKSEYYKTTKASLNIIESVYNQSHGQCLTEAKEALQTCKFALENLERNKNYFEKAYMDLDSKLMLLYQNTFALIVCMSSILIINTTEINENCEIKFKEFRNGLLRKNKCIQNIEKFNDICRNKKLPSIKKFNEKLEELEDNFYLTEDNDEIDNGVGYLNTIRNFGDKFKEKYPKTSKTVGITLGVGALIGAVALVIYASRFAIMFFFYKKNSLAQDAEYLSSVIQANSLSVEYQKGGKVKERQQKLSKKIAKLGQVLDSDYKQAEFNASNAIQKDDRKISKSVEGSLVSQNDIEADRPISTNDDNLFI